MKKLFIVLMLSFVVSICFGNYHYKLVVKTTTLNKSKLTLDILGNGSRREIMSTTSSAFTNNTLSISGNASQPSNFASISVSIGGRLNSLIFVLDSGLNHIDLNIIGDKYKSLKVSNSSAKGNMLYTEAQKIIFDTFEVMKPKKGEVNVAIPRDLMVQASLKVLAYLQTHPKDFASLLLMNFETNTDRSVIFSKSILAAIDQLSDELKQSSLGQQLQREQHALVDNIEAAEAGKPVPEFTVNDFIGGRFSNSSLAGQNYIIAFSAVWCIPCQERIPKLVELYDRHKAQGLKIVYFNNDGDSERWKNHVEKNNISNWINVSEGLSSSQSKIQKSFGIYAIPTFLLVNKEGIIVYNSSKEEIDDVAQLGLKVKELYK
ncbi:MAG: TlpA family protein disulfide reductase [Pedobacter sp.]|nr:MAG: TlpA family protein disulfide reductase [Pedobacter sp.]